MQRAHPIIHNSESSYCSDDISTTGIVMSGVSIYNSILGIADASAALNCSMISCIALTANIPLVIGYYWLIECQEARRFVAFEGAQYLEQSASAAYQPQIGEGMEDFQRHNPLTLDDAMTAYTQNVTSMYNAGHIDCYEYRRIALAQFNLVQAHKNCRESVHNNPHTPDPTVAALSIALTRFKRDTSIPNLEKNKKNAFLKNTALELVRGLLLTKYIAMAALGTITLPYIIAAVGVMTGCVIARNTHAFFKPVVSVAAFTTVKNDMIRVANDALEKPTPRISGAQAA